MWFATFNRYVTSHAMRERLNQLPVEFSAFPIEMFQLHVKDYELAYASIEEGLTLPVIRKQENKVVFVNLYLMPVSQFKVFVRQHTESGSFDIPKHYGEVKRLPTKNFYNCLQKLC